MAPARRTRKQEGSGDALPKLYLRRGKYVADFRRWGRGQHVILRDPDAPTWPRGGEWTMSEEVAAGWALRYLQEFREDERRRHLKLGPKPTQLGPALDAWLGERKRKRTRNTWHANRTGTNHFRDSLGEGFSTHRLSTAVLQQCFDEYQALGYAPATLRNWRDALSQFLRWLGQRERNAALSLELPAVQHEEVQPWTGEEREALREAADRLDRQESAFRHCRLALELALASGMRRNELFAAQWQQIDPATKTIRVTHQVAAGSRELVALKGARARSKGRGPGRTALLLPSWWEFHQAGARGFILPDRHGEIINGHLFTPIRQRLHREAEVEVGVGWHKDRHTYAFDFILEGGKFEELRNSLGHSSIVTTEQLYVHFHDDVAAEQARRRIYKEDPLRLVR